MIRWLSGSRLKSCTEHEPSPLTNDPLAVISQIGDPDGKCHLYAVSRVNPLYKEEESVLEDASDLNFEQGLSPRKSVSSGYESRCNSSDSSSCAECEAETKSIKAERKLRDLSRELADPSKLKRRSRKHKNGSPPGSSNLSPIPEGKVDWSIPPPVWPRCEEIRSDGGSTDSTRFDTQVPGRMLFHNGTTNPLNFVYKYNEKYPKSQIGNPRRLWEHQDENCLRSGSAHSEYERNWEEFSRNDFDDDKDQIHSLPNCRKGSDDSGKGTTPESTMERQAEKKELTQEVLRELSDLIAYAMSSSSSTRALPLDDILKTLSKSIQKSLEILSQTESDESLRRLCESLSHNQNLRKVSRAFSNGERKVESTGRKLSINGEFILYGLRDLKDEMCSSSSSSGCRDIYNSSSSSADKYGAYSSSSFGSVHERQKIFLPEKHGEMYDSIDSIGDRAAEDAGTKGGDALSRRSPKVRSVQKSQSSDSDVSLIRHEREPSTSSVESTLGFSDVTPTPSDSVSGVLNPVFLHQDIYSVAKSVRNAIMCESLNRTNSAVRDCGSSAFDKLISAKRKISTDSRTEPGESLPPEGKTASGNLGNTILKKVEHPYYIAMGRPDFTLDLPQAELLMKKIASSKRRRCWCRLVTSILGLVFFLLSVMMVSLVITKGRRMFGAI